MGLHCKSSNNPLLGDTWQWGELNPESPDQLSPLHAKVLHFLGEDVGSALVPDCGSKDAWSIINKRLEDLHGSSPHACSADDTYIFRPSSAPTPAWPPRCGEELMSSEKASATLSADEDMMYPLGGQSCGYDTDDCGVDSKTWQWQGVDEDLREGKNGEAMTAKRDICCNAPEQQFLNLDLEVSDVGAHIAEMQEDVDKNPGPRGNVRRRPMALAEDLVSAESPTRATSSLSACAGDIANIEGDGLKSQHHLTRLLRVSSNLPPWQTESVKAQQSADASSTRRHRNSGEGTSINASPARAGRRLLCTPGKGERHDLRPNKVQSVAHSCVPTCVNSVAHFQTLEEAGNLASGSDLHEIAGIPACLVTAAASHAGRPPRRHHGTNQQAACDHMLKPRAPSCGRRHATPKRHDTTRRCASTGPVVRRGAGRVQSNRRLIRNALEWCCLKGDHNRELREQTLRTIDQELSSYEHFVLVFRSVHTGRHDIRAVYGYRDGAWPRLIQLLPSPQNLEERMVAQLLRYDCGSKEFKDMPSMQELTSADAAFLQHQYLPPQNLHKSRVVA